MAGFCTTCAAALDPGSKFCGACGTIVDSAPQHSVTKPGTAAPVVLQTQSRRYPALRIIAVVLKILAVITAIAGLVGGLSFTSLTGSSYLPYAGALSGLAVILGGLCYALFLWASAEMINVALDIEENTRRAAASLAG
jgi:protein-S-isoprenylcysteine O-methyltransferase Ste14